MMPNPDEQPFPSVEELNAASVDAFVAAMAPLVEGAPAFLRRLADARPFDSDVALLDGMHAVAAGLSEEEQIELIDAHPRIGADPSSLSAMSAAEQGQGSGDGEDAQRHAYVNEELANLNELYEARFGFRYVVFVAGRPKEAIVELMEHALRNDRDAELRRGLHDVVYIAGDRLTQLRGGPAEDDEEEDE